MSDAYQRGNLLYQHRRYDLAAEEFRRDLQASPDSGRALAMLALCLTNLDQHNAAAAEAQRAISVAPQMGFAHYTMAIVILRTPLDKLSRPFRLELSKESRERHKTLRRLRAARVPSVEAVRLDPDNCDYLALLASIEIDRGRSDVGLALTQRSLSVNPNHERSANLHAFMLRMRSRDEEARQTLTRNLAVNPENAQTDQQQGWLDLYAGKGEAALGHFTESLRLDPANKQALSGRKQALALKSPIRGPFKRVSLWLTKWIGPRWFFRLPLILYFSGSAAAAAAGGRGGNDMLAFYGVLLMVSVLLVPLIRWWKRRRLRRATTVDPKELQEIFK